jgi:hypothetical protein
MRSGFPAVNHGHTRGLKVIHISGHNRQAVNKGSGRDESVTIGARAGHVERGASLGHSSINCKDATVERGQNMAIHPGSKNRPCFWSRRSIRREAYAGSVWISRFHWASKHLRRILAEWVTHYNEGRPDLSLGPGIPEPAAVFLPVQGHDRHSFAQDCKVAVRAILGGLHHEYRWEWIAA